MYSLVINIAVDVNRAVLLEITMPTEGVIKPIVELPTAELVPTSISVMINNIFFIFNDLYIFLYFSLSAFREFQYIFIVVFFCSVLKFF